MKPIIPKYFLSLTKAVRYNTLQKQHKEIFFTQLAFTLVELIVTIAIIGVLAAIAIPAYQGYLDKAKTVRAISDIENIGRRLHDYHIDNNNYPASLAEIGADNILDPWGNPYQYLNLSDPNIKGAKGKARKDHNLVPINSDFDLYSMGKDGQSVSPLTAKASRDGIVRANNGRFIDSASIY
ncbi:MAG: prepilin-type N-terminal cleavage/methylation domain-containing protein [Candidatus Nitrotoga sp.]